MDPAGSGWIRLDSGWIWLDPAGFRLDSARSGRNRQDPAFVLKVKPYKTMKVDGRVVVKPGTALSLQQADGTAKVDLTFVVAARKFIEPPKGAKKNPLAGSVPPMKEDLSDNANFIILYFHYIFSLFCYKHFIYYEIFMNCKNSFKYLFNCGIHVSLHPF